MIARVSILLPFNLFIREGDQFPTLELTTPEYRIKLHSPAHFADRASGTAGVLDSAISLGKARAASFSDSYFVDGRRVAEVNVIVLDFLKPEFDRRAPDRPDAPRDPDIDLVFGIANAILAALRVHSRAFQIKDLVPHRDAYRVRYLTDDGNELEQEDGKIRCLLTGGATIGLPVLTPDAIAAVGSPNSSEPYVWDQLLLDAYGLLPDVGGTIVMAAAALETFIAWVLDVLHEEHPLPAGVWDWIKNRNNDHTKEPSVREKFDVLLRAFTGRSLKDEQKLWQHYQELREARNTLVHEGIAVIGKRETRVDANKAKELVDNANEIIKWIESLVPEPLRRARTEAVGPFSRRLASEPTFASSLQITPDGQNKGPIRVRAEEPAVREGKNS